LKDFDNLKIDDIEPCVASESCDELSDDVFSKPLVLAKGEWSTMTSLLSLQYPVLHRESKEVCHGYNFVNW